MDGLEELAGGLSLLSPKYLIGALLLIVLGCIIYFKFIV